MSANGQLLASELAPIGGGFYLENSAAAAFNAMNATARARYGRSIGVVSAYRTLAQQWYFWNLYQSGRGNLAAYPGTSNHGWGKAIDVTQDGRQIIDAIGRTYGFSKPCSDAQSEWWHVIYNPSCTGATWRPHRNPYPFLPLQIGKKGVRRPSGGIWVYILTGRLRNCNYLKAHHGSYDYTVETAVKNFQRHHHLLVDGITGVHTWTAVKSVEAWCKKNHRHDPGATPI